jgi:hypothetical protein
MAPANNSLRASIPSLADVERRRRELFAWQAAHRAPAAGSPTASSDDASDDEDPALEEVNRLGEYLESLQALENLQQNEVPESPGEPYPAEYPSSSPTAPEPTALAEPALYGLAGLVVRSLAAHTEADPAALLLQFLAAFGNILGPALYYTVGATRHGLNLFVVLVGESSKARKGTSWREISGLFTEVDPLWVARRITTASPTAYGIIHALRDQDPPTDRRLFLLAEEFAFVLHMLGQRTGQLPPLLRCAWDGGDLSACNGSYNLHATNADLSIVAHITESVHIATHFDSRPGVAANSYLLLGDGELSLAEIAAQTRLFHGVDLVTLSACNTAFTNRTEDGREIDSFGTIAQRLGARGVIASLWSVNDNSTAVLMQTMYRLRQQNAAVTKDEALRQAQLRLLSGDSVAAKTDANRGVTLVDAPSTSNATTNWSHPYYWAPFILIGNWK